MKQSVTYKQKAIRLKEYDYSQSGAYFITICTKNKECLFGKIKNEKMILNDAGKIALNELNKTSKIRKNMKIDCFIVMPNHIHAIVEIRYLVGAYCNTPTKCNNIFKSPSNNLGSMVRGYKSTVTKQINKMRKMPNATIWQRNYYEHIIRNEKSFEEIYNYIIHNSSKWKEDKFFV